MRSWSINHAARPPTPHGRLYSIHPFCREYVYCTLCMCSWPAAHCGCAGAPRGLTTPAAPQDHLRLTRCVLVALYYLCIHFIPNSLT